MYYPKFNFKIKTFKKTYGNRNLEENETDWNKSRICSQLKINSITLDTSNKYIYNTDTNCNTQISRINRNDG